MWLQRRRRRMRTQTEADLNHSNLHYRPQLRRWWEISWSACYWSATLIIHHKRSNKHYWLNGVYNQTRCEDLLLAETTRRSDTASLIIKKDEGMHQHLRSEVKPAFPLTPTRRRLQNWVMMKKSHQRETWHLWICERSRQHNTRKKP